MSTSNLTYIECSNSTNSSVIQNVGVKTAFYVLYTTIFTLGVIGNALVCHVVLRNKAMQTVTNVFIMNLALSDILLCALAVPFTPLYTFLGKWVFGQIICHLVPYAQGASVYISALTLTSIAVDRYFVIIHPLRPRMTLATCVAVICGIWLFALLATLPYGLYMELKPYRGHYVCEEDWPNGRHTQRVYGALTTVLQFVLPFCVIAFCYVCVSLRLNDRARLRRGTNNARKEEADRERKRRTNRMLIAMVTIFVVSWLPLNLINVVNDFYEPSVCWIHLHVFFFLGHCLAMSSTCYNPFLYAWLNENFRKEFKQVLPCFRLLEARYRHNHPNHHHHHHHHHNHHNRRRRHHLLTDRTLNGTETVQETLLNSVAGGGDGYGGGGDYSPVRQLQPREPIAAPIVHTHHTHHTHVTRSPLVEEVICLTAIPSAQHQHN